MEIRKVWKRYMPSAYGVAGSCIPICQRSATSQNTKNFLDSYKFFEKTFYTYNVNHKKFFSKKDVNKNKIIEKNTLMTIALNKNTFLMDELNKKFIENKYNSNILQKNYKLLQKKMIYWNLLFNT